MDDNERENNVLMMNVLTTAVYDLAQQYPESFKIKLAAFVIGENTMKAKYRQLREGLKAANSALWVDVAAKLLLLGSRYERI